MSEKEERGVIDKLVEKAISRKFLAWITATAILVLTAGLTSSDWVTITAIYIGGQTVIDVITSVRSQ
jgi:uncharacterized membrane protein